MQDQKRIEVEAAVFRKLIAHLQKHPDVQNIDLMNLSYFCRNCLSKWYRSAADERGLDLNYDQARDIIYGMPYSDYKETYQEKATDEQLEKLEFAQKMATE
ncbi:MAG: DUF1244 domain-containing protein [Pseudomonadota bacterium]